jgi:hypothetical protein
LPLVTASAPNERPAPVDTAVSVAMSSTAIRSSTIRIPTTSSRSLPRISCSSKALAMMVVLEMAMIAPVNRLSSTVQSKARPIAKPSHSISTHWTSATSPAEGPSSISLPRRNSRPSANMSRMTPSSDSVWVAPTSANSGKATCGPTSTPARM